MGIDLTKIQPHKVSRDLSGYITYIYGPPKSGKTTLASQMPKPLLLAFEKGYNAIPGILAQDVTTWGEMKQVVRELKKPEVKEMFSTICIDTVDIAAILCDKYVCNQNNVDTISKIPFGQGWNLVKKEFEDTFRTITQLGYAVFFISHAKEKTFQKEDGSSYDQILPSVSTTYNSIVENMADIYGYMHPVKTNDGMDVNITLRSTDGSIRAGGRFKYISPEIHSDYDSLVKALNDAIDKEAKLTGNKYVTDARETLAVQVEYDYDELMHRFEAIVGDLMAKDSNYYMPRITQIIERYLGKGKKVADTTLDQAEFIYLIISDIESELISK